MKSIFEYFNFRCYLADYYAQAKANHPHFSYRTFSNKIGYKSKDFIYRVINKEWPISEESINKIASAISLSEGEHEYFANLVRFNQAKTGSDKNRYFKLLGQSREKNIPARKVKLLQAKELDFFSHWYNPVVFNLLAIMNFKGDFPFLARMVRPAILAREAKQAVKTLMDLGLVIRDESGFYRLTEASVSTQNELRSLGLLNYYIKGAELAADAIANLPREERNVTGVTVSISKQTYDKMVERLNAVRQELALMADSDQDPERVYQLNFQIIPMSQIIPLSGGEK